MKLIYKGKTKNVFELENGNFLLKFKDDVTGEDGVFDPGANQVGLSIEGIGREDLRLSSYFFEKINQKGYKTHFVKANIDDVTMEVIPASFFGNGIELIARYKAVGSFMRRYGMYAKEGQDIEGFVEFTLKDDERNDPPISKQTLEILGILNQDEYDELTNLMIEISNIIRDELEKKSLILYDIKLEFGKSRIDNQILLIDEISGGNMRVYSNDEYVEPMKLAKIMLG